MYVSDVVGTFCLEPLQHDPVIRTEVPGLSMPNVYHSMTRLFVPWLTWFVLSTIARNLCLICATFCGSKCQWICHAGAPRLEDSISASLFHQGKVRLFVFEFIFFQSGHLHQRMVLSLVQCIGFECEGSDTLCWVYQTLGKSDILYVLSITGLMCVFCSSTVKIQNVRRIFFLHGPS